VAAKCKVGREEQDRFALESHRRAVAAQREGRFAEEIIPLPVPVGKGAPPLLFDRDEGPRPDTSLEALGKLPPAFQKDGTVTAANASKINDGAAALVLTSGEKAGALKLPVLARIRAFGSAARKPVEFTTAPADAIPKVLRRSGLTERDIDLFEINEAFAVVNLAVNKMLGLDTAKINVNGGAIALGHPIGASGARILVTLLYAMRRLDKKRGMAAICIGGGEASGMILER